MCFQWRFVRFHNFQCYVCGEPDENCCERQIESGNAYGY